MSINRHLLRLDADERVCLYASGSIFMRSCDVIREQRYWISYSCVFEKRNYEGIA